MLSTRDIYCDCISIANSNYTEVTIQSYMIIQELFYVSWSSNWNIKVPIRIQISNECIYFKTNHSILLTNVKLLNENLFDFTNVCIQINWNKNWGWILDWCKKKKACTKARFWQASFKQVGNHSKSSLKIHCLEMLRINVHKVTESLVYVIVHCVFLVALIMQPVSLLPW